MKFDKRYWIFIAAAMIFSGIASASTLYMASVQKYFRECSSVAAACFAGIGKVFCIVLGILALLPVMVAIPPSYTVAGRTSPGR